MTSLTLVIGNKNYSSWSLRPWLAMRQAGVTLNEIRIPLYQKGTAAVFQTISAEMHAGFMALCQHMPK